MISKRTESLFLVIPITYFTASRFFASKLPEVKKEHNGLLEKSHIRWFSFEDLRRDKKQFRRFYQAFIDKFLHLEGLIEKKIFEKRNRRDTRKNI